MSTPRLNILLSGMIAGVPHLGGATWAVLQYVLGFRRLGHSVFFVEPVRSGSLRPSGVPLSASVNAVYFRAVCREFGLEDSAILLLEETGETFGLELVALRRAAQRADVFINIAGMLQRDDLTAGIPLRAYLDLDPAFTQLWHEAEKIDMRYVGHNRFLTLGQAIGSQLCSVPTSGLSWIGLFPPIVLDYWPKSERVSSPALTTVGNWRAYGSISCQGVFYGQKAHSLRPLLAAAGRTPQPFRLALAIHDEEKKDLQALAENKWELVDPAQVTNTPDRYQDFIQTSWAEFGLAKSGYVASRCGWFSDRSVCYLASGKPVLAQETGFSPFLPTGDGLLSFETTDDLVNGIELLRSAYDHHARAARDLAQAYFDSDKVLRQLLERMGASS